MKRAPEGPESSFAFAGGLLQDQRFIIFENDTMKLTVNEVKLTGLCARNCGNIQQT